MLRSLSLAVLFVSSAATACPNLTGKFLCTNDDGTPSPVEISQVQQNGVTTYTVSSEDKSDQLVADGQNRTTVEKGDGLVSTLNRQVTCLGEKLHWIEKIHLGAEGSEEGLRIELDSKLRIGEKGELISDVVAEMGMTELGFDKEEYTVVCPRQ